MKDIIKSVLVTVLIATMSGNTFADSGPRGHSPHSYHNYHHGSGNLDWLGAILLFGFTAAIVNAMTSQPPAPPPATYVVPPPLQPAPQVIPQSAQTGMWYYCRSAEQYYPYVRSCPEEWELLPPIPPQ
jgi:hypothetical protein